MWTDLVVLTPKLLDQHLRIDPVLEPLHAQALVSELAIEGFVRAVLPRLAGVDVRGIDVRFRQPAQDRSGDELWAIVGSEVPRSAMRAHEPRENLDDATRADAAGHVDGQALTGVFYR